MYSDEYLKKVVNDFPSFIELIWEHLNLPEPTPVQMDMAKYMQHAPRRCCVQGFRGIAKSYEASGLAIWHLLRDPNKKILVVSASKERADAFSTFTRRLIDEVPLLHHLKPKNGQRDSKISFDVGPALADHSPSVKSVGITGQLTGSRADIIIADDIEVMNNSDTQTKRDKLSELVKEFDAVLKPLKSSMILYLGTPQTEMSIYNRLPERGYQIRIWTARYPTLENRVRYNGRLAPWIEDNLDRGIHKPNDPVDPKRFDHVDLLEREASYGRSGFALQFMLDTSLSDANKYPLKLSDLIVMDVNKDLAPAKVVWCNGHDKIKDLPADGLAGDKFYSPMYISESWTKYQGSVMVIDPSGRGTDMTSFCVIKMLGGILYVTKVGSLAGGYDEPTLKQLALAAQDQQVNEIVIEDNFGDGMFTALFKPVLKKYWRCNVSEVKHLKQKEVRIIDTLEPVMNQHRLVMDASIIQQDYNMFASEQNRQYRLFYQMTRLTKDRGSLKHDDAIDCLAMGVAYWLEQMGTDTDSIEAELEEKAILDSLEEFTGFDSSFGTNDTTTWQ